MKRLATRDIEAWYTSGDERILWVSGLYGVAKPGL